MSIDQFPKNNGQDTNVPHSGKSGIEKPVFDFGDMTIQEAIDKGLIDAHVDPETGEQTFVPHTIADYTDPKKAPRTPEFTPLHETKTEEIKKGVSKKLVAGLAAGAVGTAAAIGGAVALFRPKEDVSAVPAPQPSVSAPQTPGVAPPPAETSAPAPVETPKPTSSPEATSGDALIEKYRALSVEEFNKLPRSERLKVVWDEYDAMWNKGRATSYFSQDVVGGKMLGEYNPTLVASASNSGEEIIGQSFYAEQTIFAQEDPSTIEDSTLGEPLVKDTARKMISGYSYYVESPDGTTIPAAVGRINELIDSRDTTGQMKFPSVTIEKTSDLKEEADKEGNRIKYKEVLWTAAGDTASNNTTFVLETFTDKDGKERTLWLKYSEGRIQQ